MQSLLSLLEQAFSLFQRQLCLNMLVFALAKTVSHSAYTLLWRLTFDLLPGQLPSTLG